jgi:hypothetical protein
MARFEVQPHDVMQEFRIDQHVEADRQPFLFPADDRAADLVVDAEDFQEEIIRDRHVRGDFQFRTIEREMEWTRQRKCVAVLNRRPTKMILPGRSTVNFWKARSRGASRFGSSSIFKGMAPSFSPHAVSLSPDRLTHSETDH